MCDKPKKRGRGRPKGSKNKPKPPGWIKPSKRKDAANKAKAAAKATKATKAKATPVVKPAFQAADVNVASLEAGGRKCQQRFTTSGEELHFTSKKDGRVALTTNTPREVEAVDPQTNVRVHLFNSCSDASRATNINRTKMSRTCRKGGGVLESNSHGTLLYRYTESSNVTGTPGSGTLTPATSDDEGDDEDPSMGVGAAGEEEQDVAALAAAAVSAAVAAGDASAYAEAVKSQRKVAAASADSSCFV